MEEVGFLREYSKPDHLQEKGQAFLSSTKLFSLNLVIKNIKTLRLVRIH